MYLYNTKVNLDIDKANLFALFPGTRRFGYNMAADILATTLSLKRPLKALKKRYLFLDTFATLLRASDMPPCFINIGVLVEARDILQKK